MKQLSSFLLLFFFVSVSAQTSMFIGAIDNDWNNGNNWNTGLVPTGSINVLIQEGKNAVATSPVVCNSIALNSGSTLTIATNLNCNTHIMVPEGAILIWTGGQISAQTITNEGQMNLEPYGTKQLINGSQLDNAGTMLITTDWAFDITDGVVNNLTGGVINLAFAQANIIGTGSGSHVLNNYGTIIKSASTSYSPITVELHNTGTIQVEAGTLQLNNPQIELINSTINVSEGANMEWFNTVTLIGNTGGNLNGQINWSGTVNVPSEASLDFDGGGTFNWGNGTLTGGGILNNLGTLSLTAAYYGVKTITGGTTLRNHNQMPVSTDWSLTIADGILDNLSSGVIDFSFPHTIMQDNSTGSHLVQNAGIIRKSASTGVLAIQAKLMNTGTLEANSGVFSIDNSLSQFNGGIYNVGPDGLLDLNQTVTLSGTLTGTLNSHIRWWGNLSVPATATLDFDGSSSLHWYSGELIGGGQLINNGLLTQTAGATKKINASTTLLNNDTFALTSDSGFTIENGSIVNSEEGTIDMTIGMQILAGAGSSSIINHGTFTKSASTGTGSVSPLVENHGTIETWAGTFQFYNLHNETDGTVTGTSHVDFPNPTSLVNHGTFAPGGNPGSMSGSGSFSMEADARLLVELYGLTSGTQYDVFNFWNNASLDGSVVVDLHFSPVIGDSFTVMTTNVITNCSLEPTTSAVYNGMEYTFSVGCVDDNKVILTLTSIQLGTAENAFAAGLKIAPNPASGTTILRNDTGKTLSLIEVSDLSGRKVRNINPSGNLEEFIDLTGLSAGTYFLKASSDNGTATKKIIVK
ncbi:T9SS type A sorting domain-containing protein [Flavobacterium silvaticum]|uniref:T9SS type A sorting domain-containing protein n=1 Tax=Flavobacterium silvaticum TaxID=1852020 RepID=A0A972FJS3_9FLAO|nr:T9SS type A sorting domain-containing protein [Flavobacterium silvaticum]NMH27256.1 T9SS type A sorting domain-containing protein [Flavobacterium silvaticum]